MRFIKYEMQLGQAFGFALDELRTIESADTDTRVILKDGRQEDLQIDVEDFCDKVFSDQLEERDYMLIEIRSRSYHDHTNEMREIKKLLENK